MNASATNAPALSLAELRDFDPRGGHGPAHGQRWRCPFCSDPERTLSVNMETGAWHCFRASCGAAGKLREFWQEPASGASSGASAPHEARGWRDRARERGRRAFDVVSHGTSCDAPPDGAHRAIGSAGDREEWRQHLRGLMPLEGTRGATYLAGRGIAHDLAALAGLRCAPHEASDGASAPHEAPEAGALCGAQFCPSFCGRPAVVWRLLDWQGRIVGAHGRYVDGRATPKARTVGDKGKGAMLAPVWLDTPARTCGPLDKAAPAVIVTEAPLDALSVAAAGFPAIALCGTSGPAWLHLACGLRRVLLAFDADDAGDRAAHELAAKLVPFGARCERLRTDGFKDWNEMLLQIGVSALADWLSWRVLLEPYERTAHE